MRLFKFSKPKTPGFGLSDRFYISVLSGQAMLPALVSTIEPKGADGAVPGFGVPLAPGASKADLQRPMERGEYALASTDRKTVLRMRVLSKEEAGFDPSWVATSPLAALLEEEVLARLRATWIVMQLSFESHDPDVYPALDFLLNLARRLGGATQGVVADPLAQRYVLPEKLFVHPRLDPRVDAREHVVVRFEPSREGWHAFTLGLQKFSLPEIEIYGLAQTDAEVAAAFLIGLAQSNLLGNLVAEGHTVGLETEPLEVRAGGLDRGQWEGIPCLELIPTKGTEASAALHAWVRAQH
ncbi:MAG: hypothetical protein M9921_01675 [Fimbriimonadaceae bacterium]|nr:hypothetical protein [Fimbriimonadaceae bacterium]